MAFVVKRISYPDSGVTVHTLFFALSKAIDKSRFTARLENHLDSISLHQIRLRKSKDYCGNHPYACPVRPGGPRPHIHSTCLEGADWVAFNDMLNNVLDEWNASANVASSLCIIRKGAKRRTEYKGHKLGNGIDSEWDRDTTPNFYVDNRKKPAMVSKYPLDTPGQAVYAA